MGERRHDIDLAQVETPAPDTTRSPRARVSTPTPTAATRPTNSCPSTVGPTWPLLGCGFVNGTEDRAVQVLARVGAADRRELDRHEQLVRGGPGAGISSIRTSRRP
jgi:hypothetical protein